MIDPGFYSKPHAEVTNRAQDEQQPWHVQLLLNSSRAGNKRALPSPGA